MLRQQVWKLAEADPRALAEREVEQPAVNEAQRLSEAIVRIREQTEDAREKLQRVEEECKQLEEHLSCLGNAQGRREQHVDRLLAGLDNAALLTSPPGSRPPSPPPPEDAAVRASPPDPEQELLRRELRLKEAATRLLVARCRSAEAELSPAGTLVAAAAAATASIRTRQSKSPSSIASPCTAAALRAQLARAKQRHQEDIAKLGAEIAALRRTDQIASSCSVEAGLRSEPIETGEKPQQPDASGALQT